ncbi:MAG: hypothetical protein E7566_04450 [Ruminococcaceae bacterium]|nr:hypothetical protein [Oscillospiraceae bacterium]
MAFNKKKPGHYTEKKTKKEKKDKRAVLSFEELPLDDYDKKEKSEIKIKLDYKRILIAVAIVFVLVLSVFVFFNNGFGGCAGRRGSSNSFSASVSGTYIDAGNFRVFDSGLLYSSDTNIVSLDRKGEERYSIQHGFAKPILKTVGDKAIAYDLGAVNFKILGGEGALFSASMEDKIYLADIALNGNYAIVTEAKDYNAKLTAFNAQNKRTYAYSFADYHITSMALNSDGSGAVVCGVSADNGLQTSIVYVLNFKSESPVAKHVVSDDLVYDCDYLSKGSVCAIGEEGAYICTDSGFSRIQKVSYNGMSLTAYDFNSDIGVVSLSLSRSGDGSNCNILYVNAKGEIEKTIETEHGVLSVSTYKNRIAVSSVNTVYLYNNSGELLESYECKSIKQIRLQSTDGVYILGLNGINGVSL